MVNASTSVGHASSKKRQRTTNGCRDKLGILFLHHHCDIVTQNNLQSIRRHNPDATVVTMGAEEALPSGYTLNATQNFKQLHSELPKTREDLLVCSWFIQNHEKCEKWWIVEWDLFCEVPVREYYQSVWHYPFVASYVYLHRHDPHWHWFGQAKNAPSDYVPYLMGALPFVFLLSETALKAICSMLIQHPFFSSNSELRFATAANRCGYAPCGFSPPNNRITWIPWDRVDGPPNIFHPVKHYVDYR